MDSTQSTGRRDLLLIKKKCVDVRALKNPSPVRNDFVWSHHLLFIFIYYGENQVRTKNPSLTPIRTKRSLKTRFLGSGIRLPVGKVPHARKHPSKPENRSLLMKWVHGIIWVKDQSITQAKQMTRITPTYSLSNMHKHSTKQNNRCKPMVHSQALHKRSVNKLKCTTNIKVQTPCMHIIANTKAQARSCGP